MYDDATLLPTVSLIHERLTLNQRERHRLRTLLRLARDAAEDNHRQTASETRQKAAGRDGVQ